ncbi:hypothetical protein SLEP1_g1910 [Rubroshorea leprosula]|uniref:FAS1 domain-containing protein n=1 Tax=Rubroshorea leprosula TaxID=152421 RepID=A0AAV5HFD0_9ROSI|nr:hypothetical protein SLEP1_g1910 [Rubroshorea leprosula]
MGHPKASSSFLFLAIFLVCSSTITTALNVTRILSNYPDFGTFSDLINRTGINDLVKNRQTITLLALDNDTIGSISGRPQDEIKRILMAHIVLDYYDTLKIQKLGKRSILLTNLYQTTGVAQDQQGFLNMTKLGPGNVVFGSAVHGSPLVAKLLGSVLAQPFNISVLHVSTPIVPAGIGEVVLAPPPPPFLPPPPAPKKAEVPSSNDNTADDSDEILVPAPSPADAPVADAPAMSNHKSPPSPNDADAQSPAPSGSRSVGSGICLAAVMGLVASLVVF